MHADLGNDKILQELKIVHTVTNVRMGTAKVSINQQFSNCGL